MRGSFGNRALTLLVLTVCRGLLPRHVLHGAVWRETCGKKYHDASCLENHYLDMKIQVEALMKDDEIWKVARWHLPLDVDVIPGSSVLSTQQHSIGSLHDFSHFIESFQVPAS
ncbi:hypothetical protein K491DRAFT_214771 [Lophiostoma macrostomum CBS 122681]|uniref:C2H2-type domain-containing protein n=1 Tax=Lophiostoma macrostomum CBS 122681 TaxID=1314788 RepID=A0A6A6SNF2_9PLEO|nr:hypothetical protein K491DRAFT_214771 [Lophiostoma macrostomum CBS 122681]